MTIKERAEVVVGEIRFSSSLTSDASVIERAITEAVAEDREACAKEACAKEAEEEASMWRATGGYHTAIRISKRIRARKP